MGDGGNGMGIREALELDPAEATRTITEAIREQVLGTLRRRGVVIGLSGGIDSSVSAALCRRALGPDRVLGLLMPERAEGSESLRLGRLVAEALGIPHGVEVIGPALEALGCYRRQDEAIRRLIPEYDAGWGFKLVVSSEARGLPVYQLVVQPPEGARRTLRLPPDVLLELVAATNFKQRTRKMHEYAHADRLRFAVVGTPNRLEHDQGFFVKGGDGAADLKPIAHLYKTQVYALAAYLGVPEEIRARPPTTETYSLPQTQEEFFFRVPLETLDLCLYARDQGISPQVLAEEVGLTPAETLAIYRDIDGKRRTSAYLHAPPLLVAAPQEH
jgi:NAD+ synthase